MMVKQVSTEENVIVTHETNIKDFVSTFFITLSNPITMIAFIAALSNINHLFDRIDFFQSTLIVLGIFSGSMLWWIILVNIALHFKQYLNDVYLKRINMVSGFFILSIGLFLIITIKT
jgi:threonine/homoserine/homoserine lactone efflux protein